MEFKQADWSIAAELGVVQPLPDLAAREIRFHYAQQYFAEAKGEEVIEDILQLTYGKKQRVILSAQMKDEHHHLRLYRQIIQDQGMEAQAADYGEAFCRLVKAQTTLVEKVFVFQILAESVSAGYCQWRLSSIGESRGHAADHIVATDEIRHLSMGHCFLSLCDPDERDQHLPRARRTELIKQMNAICRQSLTTSFVTALELEPWVDKARYGRTRLDRMITSIILSEARKAGTPMSFEDIEQFYNITPLEPA